MHYATHMQACTRLLASRVEAGKMSELEETLLYMMALEEVRFH